MANFGPLALEIGWGHPD